MGTARRSLVQTGRLFRPRKEGRLDNSVGSSHNRVREGAQA